MRVTHTFLLTHIIILGTRVTDADTSGMHVGKVHRPPTPTPCMGAWRQAGFSQPARDSLPHRGQDPPGGYGCTALGREHRAHSELQPPTYVRGFTSCKLPHRAPSAWQGSCGHRVPVDPPGVLWRCNTATEVPPHSACACGSSHQGHNQSTASDNASPRLLWGFSAWQQMGSI